MLKYTHNLSISLLFVNVYTVAERHRKKFNEEIYQNVYANFVLTFILTKLNLFPRVFRLTVLLSASFKTTTL